MIEVIRDSACIDCNLCVRICPTDVFDEVDGDHPVIARQADCQTCFLCEAYCPVDAIFVSPRTEPESVGSALLDVAYLSEHSLFGKYRRDLGWNPGQEPTAARASRAKLAAHYARIENMPPPAARASTT
jgi:NAD-dependent dihydropyrimidine dehydrogenase PreA subunit